MQKLKEENDEALNDANENSTIDAIEYLDDLSKTIEYKIYLLQ